MLFNTDPSFTNEYSKYALSKKKRCFFHIFALFTHSAMCIKICLFFNNLTPSFTTTHTPLYTPLKTPKREGPR